MNRSTNRHLGRQPPLRGRLAAIASPKLRTRYSQAATYTNPVKPTFKKSLELKAINPKLVDPPSMDTDGNDLEKDNEPVTITPTGKTDKKLLAIIILLLVLLAIGSSF